MNEDLLLELHQLIGGEEAIPYDQFKNDFNNDGELRGTLHQLIGGDSAISFNDFLGEAGFKQPEPVNTVDPLTKLKNTVAAGQEAVTEAKMVGDKFSKGLGPAPTYTKIGTTISGRPVTSNDPIINWGEGTVTPTDPEIGQIKVNATGYPSSYSIGAGSVTNAPISQEQLLRNKEQVQMNSDQAEVDRISEANYKLGSIDVDRINKFKPTDLKEVRVDANGQVISGANNVGFLTKENSSSDDYNLARADLAQFINAHQTILESSNKLLTKQFGEGWLDNVFDTYKKINEKTAELNSLSDQISKLKGTNYSPNITAHKELLNTYHSINDKYTNLTSEYRKNEASLAAISKEADALGKLFQEGKIGEEEYTQNYDRLTTLFEEKKNASNDLYQVIGGLESELSSIKDKESELVNSINNENLSDPNVAKYKKSFEEYQGLLKSIAPYEGNQLFKQYLDSYNELVGSQSTYSNLFKDRENSKENAKKLQAISDFYVKNERPKLNDVEALFNDLGFAFKNLYSEDLAVGPLSTGVVLAKEFAAKLVSDVASLVTSFPLGFNTDLGKKLAYNDLLSLETLNQEKQRISSGIRSDYKGGFRESFLEMTPKDKQITSRLGLEEGDRIMVDGEDIMGIRDKDGFLKDTSLMDPNAFNKLKGYVKDNKDRVNSELSLTRGVVQTIPSALDFLALIYGAGKLTKSLEKGATKLGIAASSETLGSISVTPIAFAQMYGNNLKEYLDKGVSPDKAVKAAIGKSAVSALVETIIGPMEGRLVAQGAEKVALANYRKVKDTTIDLIATGKIGSKDGLALIGKSIGSAAMTLGTENAEEIVQDITDKVSNFFTTGEEFKSMTLDQGINTVFSTSLITILPGIQQGISTYNRGKVDLITTALYKYTQDPDSYKKDMISAALQKSKEERNIVSDTDINTYLKLIPYIKDELSIYDVDENKKVAITGLVTSRFFKENKLKFTENDKLKEALKKDITAIDGEIAAIVNGNKKVEVDPSTEGLLNIDTPAADNVEEKPTKTFAGRDITDTKVFSDFDNTLYNPKTGELTPAGKELQDKLKSGEIKPEDVEILTARTADQAVPISKFFPSVKMTTDLSPEGKAAKVAEAEGNTLFIDDNKDNLDAVRNTGKGEVIDSGTITPQVDNEVIKAEEEALVQKTEPSTKREQAPISEQTEDRPKKKVKQAMVRSINELKAEIELMKRGKKSPEKDAKIAEFEREIALQEKMGVDPDKGRLESVEELEQPVQKTAGQEVAVQDAPKGTHLNIGLMEERTNTEIPVEDILTKLPKGVKVISQTKVGGTEPTVSVEISRPLTDSEMNQFLADTKQQAIPQLSDGKGVLYDLKRGTKEAWGEFDTKKFVLQDGNKLGTDSSNKNDSPKTQGFFSDVVTGKSDKYKPNKEWEPSLTFTPNQSKFKRVYDQFKGMFDMHIATSIPTFRDIQIKVGNAISEMYKDGATMYDIGGSEGGFVKAITKYSKGKVKTFNLDPNPDMKAAHDKNPVKGSEIIPQAFYEGFEENGVSYPAHVPQKPVDVVHESMTFQFITPKRAQFVKEVKDKYLKPDGIFITEEKLSTDPETYKANEKEKEKYKDQYYTKEQQSVKVDDVLVGMKNNQADVDEYRKVLEDNFKYVEQYWDAGNFKGFVASDSKEKVDKFTNKVGKLEKVAPTPTAEAQTSNVESLTSERIVYDREPTADDGVYKILGDENNIIYRVNPETGRIQEYSDGFWSNTASNPIARGTARKEGFQKITDPSQKQNTEANSILKDINSTNKALGELTEDQVEEVEDITSEYILSVASNKLNTIIEESNLPESIKKIIRKRFSLNEKGEYVSSIPFDKKVKSKDVLLAKRFTKDVGAEILKEKYNKNTQEYSNELDKLYENIDNYFQSLFDAEQNGDVVKTSPEIASIVNIIDEIQDKFNEADNSTPKTTAEAYHQAKKDGSSPELVKAVEDLLGTQPAAEPKKTTPKTSKTDSEIKRVQDEIDYTERQIEDFQAEIANEKENVKADIKEVRDKIAKVRSSNASKAAKEDRIEELKGEIEDIQDNYEGIVEQYKNDIEDNRKDLKKLKRELAKLEATKKAEVAVESTPAATKTEAPQKEVETLLEPIGKTTKEREEQIYKFFALPTALGNKEKAREIARVTNNLWENIAKQLGKRSGLNASQWIKSRVAMLGKTTVEDALARGGKFQVIGEKGAATLDAAQEANTRLDNLAVAKEMEAAGKDHKTIKLATGWERGADSKFRYEIGDGKLIEGVDIKQEGLTLGDIYVNEELFKAYPELSKVNIGLLNLDPETNAGFDLSTNTIFLNKQKIDDNSLYFLRRQLLKTLEHEATHLVQQAEGFNRGGSTGEFIREILNGLNNNKGGVYESNNGEQKITGFQQSFKNSISTGAFKEDFEELKNLSGVELESKINRLAFNMYYSLAGEVEARNIEDRMAKSPEQRRISLLEETADISKEDQIIIQDSFDGLADAMNNGSVKLQAEDNQTLPEAATNIANNLITELDRMIAEMSNTANIKAKGITTTEALKQKKDLQAVRAELLNNMKDPKWQVDAYHGTPYMFDKFSTDNIGTGEGAQAFGWGLYFTDSEGISEFYANALSKPKLKNKAGEEIEISNELGNLIKLIYTQYRQLDPDFIKKKIKVTASTIGAKWTDNAVKELEAIGDFEIIPFRFKYKVSLHEGKTPDQYTWLEWDKPLPKKLIDLYKNRIGDDLKNFNGEEKPATGKQYYQKFSNDPSSQKELSLFLLENGIDGIKYPAESISRGATADTARGYNYVVFDENAVTIKEQIQFQQDAAQFRAAAIEIAKNQVIIAALDSPNASSFVHEMWHGAEGDLTAEEKQTLIDEYNSTFGENATDYNTDVSETAARMWEKYLSNGRQVTENEVSDPKRRGIIQEIFDKFTEYLQGIYNGVIEYTSKGKTREINISPAVQALFDNIMSITPTASTTTEPTPGTVSSPINTEKEALDNLKKAALDLFFGNNNVGIAFNPQNAGELQADKFKAFVDSLVDYIKAKLANGKYTRAMFNKDMAEGKIGVVLEIDKAGVNYLFNQAKPVDPELDNRPTANVEEGDPRLSSDKHLASGRFDNEGISKILEDFGSTGFGDPTSQSFVAAVNIANDMGYLSPGLESEGLIRDGILEGKGVSEYESVAITHALMKLHKQMTETRDMINKNEGGNVNHLLAHQEELLAAYELFALAHNRVGTQAGRTLVYRKLAEAYKFDSVIVKERIRKEFSNLGDEQVKTLLDIVDKIEQKTKELQELNANIEEARNKETKRKAAEGVMAIKADKTTPKKDPVKSFKDFFSKGVAPATVKFQGPSGDSSPLDGYSEEEKMNVIKEFARHLVRQEGISSLTKLAERLIEEYDAIKNPNSPSLSVDDIYKALALSSNSEKKAKITEYQKNINKIKSTASRFNKIASLLNGAIPTTNTQKPKPDDLKKLDDLINDLKKIFIMEDFGYTPSESSEIVDDLQKVMDALQAIRMTDSMADVNAQAQELRKIIGRVNAQMKVNKLQQKLDDIRAGILPDTRVSSVNTIIDAKAFKLKEDIDEARAELKNKIFEARAWQSIMDSPMGKFEFKGFGKEGRFGFRGAVLKYNLQSIRKNWYEYTRRYVLGGDIGTLMLQGGYPTLMMLGKAPLQVLSQNGRQQLSYNYDTIKDLWRTSFTSFFQEFVYNKDSGKPNPSVRMYEEMMHTDNGVFAKQMGLALNRPFAAQLSKSTDEFFVNKGLGDLKSDSSVGKDIISIFDKYEKISEGAYVTGVNSLRLNMFNSFRMMNPTATINELKQYAEFVNTQTGTVPSSSTSGTISKVLLAPRLYWSRIKLITMAPFALNDLRTPEKRLVAKEKLKSLIGFGIGYAMVMLMMSLFGYDHEEDPRDSDFLKFKNGAKTIDVSAGMGKFVSLLLSIPSFIDMSYNKGLAGDWIAGDHIDMQKLIRGEEGAINLKASKEVDLLDDFNQTTDKPWDKLINRIGFSIHPTIRGVYSMVQGEDAIGKPLGSSLPSRVWNFALMNSAPLSTQDLFLSKNTILKYETDDIRKEESLLKDFWSEMTPQIIGINVNDAENNMKHLFVEDHLNRLGYDPGPSFTSAHVKKLIPELAFTKKMDLNVDKKSIASTMRTEVHHSVGSLVLKNIQENNGIGTLSEDDIKDIFVTEGERIAEFYKDYYKDQLAVWRKEFEELERKEE